MSNNIISNINIRRDKIIITVIIIITNDNIIIK